MVWVFIALALCLAAFVALGFDKTRRWRVCGKQIFSLFTLLIMLAGCFATIPTGYTGILTTFGKVENHTLDAGLQMKSPFQEIVLMDNREQKSPFVYSAFSSDIQQVSVSGSINYNIDKSTAMNLYQEVGTSYFNTLISPRLLENTKAVFSKYSAENLVASRELLSVEIRDRMLADLSSYGINIISVAIEDIDFTDIFTSAVEAKQVAAQEKLTAQTKQEQQTMETEAAATRQKITAEAQAAVKRLEADAQAYSTEIQAEAEAEANRKIAESLTDSIIEYEYAKNWDGKLPSTYVGGENALPIINAAGE